MKPIRIITPDFQLLGEIDNYSSLFLTRKWHAIGDLELRISRHLKHTEHLIKGNLIIVGSSLNKVFIIKHREIELNQDGKASENWLIRALSLKSIIGQRMTVPPITTAYDNKQGDAETVMKHYIERNIVLPVDPDRVIQQIIIAANQNRGPSVSWQSRYKNLAEEMINISSLSELGWDVFLDIQQNKWVFDVDEGRDLTVNQSVLPPVIFSPQFESLQSLHYTESELNYKNTAYVAGQGEGIERRIVLVGDATGLNRHEIFVDARDIAEQTEDDPPVNRPEADIINDLTLRGQQQLNDFIQEQYLEGQVLTKSRLIYEKDYDLGDIVTLQNRDWNITMDIRLTGVKEIYEQSGFRVEGTFGKPLPTLIDKIKREIGQVAVEIRK
jgi:Siphovirus ReqiPepy6 Gp37-like protein